MENRGCNFFSNSVESCSSNKGGSGGQRSNSIAAWDFWQLGTTTTTTSSQSQLIQWNNNNTNSSFARDLTIGQTLNSTCPLNSFKVERPVNEGEYYFQGEGGGGIRYPTDHHLMCLNLNLGKRHYIENNNEPQGGGQVLGFVMNKRGRQYLPGGDGGLMGPSNSSRRWMQRRRWCRGVRWSDARWRW